MLEDLMVKAKREDGKGWVEGYYSKHPHPISGFLWDFVFDPYYDELEECGYDNGYQIKAPTICRSTGQRDDAGNVIYENDILYEADGNDDGYFYVVKWSEEDLSFNFVGYEQLPDGLRAFASTPWRNTTIIGAYTVIGNTIDNPKFEMNGTLSEEELRKIRLTQLIEAFSGKVSVSLKEEQATFTYNGEEYTINLIPEADEAIRVEYQVAKYVLENLEKEDMER